MISNANISRLNTSTTGNITGISHHIFGSEKVNIKQNANMFTLKMKASLRCSEPKIGRSHSMNFSFWYVGNKLTTESTIVNSKLLSWIPDGASKKSKNYGIKMGEILIFSKKLMKFGRKNARNRNRSTSISTDQPSPIFQKKSILHDSEPIENSPVSMVIYFNFPPLYLRFLEGCTLLNALISTELFGIISN